VLSYADALITNCVVLDGVPSAVLFVPPLAVFVGSIADVVTA
jgi:hypothetical protein